MRREMVPDTAAYFLVPNFYSLMLRCLGSPPDMDRFMRRTVGGLLIFTMMLALGGCVGLVNGYLSDCFSKECRDLRKDPFPALRTDWKFMTDGFPGRQMSVTRKVLASPIFIVDAPISLAVDTLALPFYGVAKIPVEGKPELQGELEPEGKARPPTGQIGSEKAD